MTRRIMLAAFTCVLVTTGCSSISVRYDYDTSADFQKYRTFGWLPQPTTTTSGNAREAQARNSLLDKRILSAVNRNLTETKGMQIDTDSPDLLLCYHTGAEQKIQVTDWGYRYPSYYGGWGWGGRDIDVSEWTEGTLIIDFIDSETEQLVWRGIATAAIDPNPSPERVEKEINQAVDKMLAGYPPKR